MADSRWRRFAVWGVLAVMAVLAVGRLVEREPEAWGLAVGFFVVTFLLAGPVTWAARASVSSERRERLRFVAGGALLFSVPFVLAFGLLSGSLLLLLDAGTLGATVGLAAAVLVERTAVPEELRGTTP